ncbi:MAG: N-acetyltransferase [Alcaligenaceae bacterium]|uniref:GNAT family N-acetyltransferase n=1 Tax=Paenalcaligenes hermetiae TaxID=1157987 RepID=A0ABP9M315_9BURK|nr:GNAT family N-acetyltransferase [Paenalcaligenes sp.]NLJ62969.1 N-acetyltransferase [Alcaligenaceae bacterium]
MKLDIQHNTEASRFEYHENQLLCHLDYQIQDNIMAITHTIVPKALGGRGIAGQLTEAAFAFARNNELKINPVCSYTATYFQRHPEYQSLLAQ